MRRRCSVDTSTRPNSLSRWIKAVKSNLESVGITYEFDSRRSTGTYITLSYDIASSLPPYQVDASKILGASHGGDSNGDNANLVDLFSTPKSEDGGNNGDNNDDYGDIDF